MATMDRVRTEMKMETFFEPSLILWLDGRPFPFSPGFLFVLVIIFLLAVYFCFRAFNFLLKKRIGDKIPPREKDFFESRVQAQEKRI